MTAFMLYALFIALLLGAAGVLLERLVAQLPWPRRIVWLAALIASCGLPLYSIVVMDGRPTSIGQASPAVAAGPAPTAVAAVLPVPTVQGREVDWPRWNRLDFPLALAWIVVSLSLVVVYALAWVRLYRIVKRSRSVSLDGSDLLVADDLGPAVFGFLKPRIVVPAWMLSAEPSMRAAVLAHEREHIAAHDHLLSLVAALLVAAVPWNLPLWWQLRRLRFAMELDCDRRVLARGARADAYSEVLLAVQERRSAAHVGMLALLEPASRLERRIRIMMEGRKALAPPAIAASLITTALFLVTACAVNPPAVAPLRKPPPVATTGTGHLPSWINKAENIVVERYGARIGSAKSKTASVDLLFDRSGHLQQSHLELTNQPFTKLEPGARRFSRYGISPQDAAESTVFFRGPVKLDGGSRFVTIYIYDPGHVLVSRPKPSPKSADIDRRIVERYFPDVFRKPPPAHTVLWVVLDHQGRVVATGRQTLSAAPAAGAPLAAQLPLHPGQAYAGGRISIVRWSPILNRQSQRLKDQDGNGVPLYSAWLSEKSSSRGANPNER